MMEYYKYLYLSEKLEKKKGRVVDRLERGKFQPGIHLVLLPRNERNQLEILNAAYFRRLAYLWRALRTVMKMRWKLWKKYLRRCMITLET